MKFYTLAAVVLVALFLFLVFHIVREMDSKYNGIEVIAQCITLPEKCNKRTSPISVAYKSKVYKVLIGRRECNRSEYLLNEDYTFLYSSRFDHLITLDRQPEMKVPRLVGGFLLALFFMLRMKKKSSAKK